MSKILEEMRSQYIQSMKNKDNLRKNLLSTLIGMIEQEKKPNIDLTDNMVLDKINSFKKKAIELIQIYEDKGNIEQLKDAQDELDIINSYLPKQLSVDEMNKIISDNNLSSKKDIMQFFKQNYSNQYDGKTLSNLCG